MFHDKIDSSEGFNQSNFLFHQEICTLSLEFCVLDFLDDNYDVSGLHAWVLICLTMEGVLSIVRSALIDCHVNNFLLFLYFLSIASFAFKGIINNFALSTTIVTRTLRLSVHAWPKLLHLGDDTATTTSSTLLDGAFRATLALACSANTFSVHSNFSILSIE